MLLAFGKQAKKKFAETITAVNLCVAARHAQSLIACQSWHIVVKQLSTRSRRLPDVQ